MFRVPFGDLLFNLALLHSFLSVNMLCCDSEYAMQISDSVVIYNKFLHNIKLFLQVDNYIDGVGQDVPLLVLGGAGCGKSSVMAKIVDNTLHRAQHHKIRGFVYE